MSGLFNQSENTNNFLFVFVWLLFILSAICMFNGYYVRTTELIFLFLLIAGSIIYGFVSKNPVKSFSLGLLIWLSWFFSSIISEVLNSGFAQISGNILPILGSVLYFVLFGSLNGGIGYFIAADHLDKRRQLLYRILALTFLFASAMFFFAGIN